MRAAPLLLALAGCAAVATVADPPLAQLDRWRGAAPAAIAAEPVVAPCPRDNPACARLHALRAEACMGLAMGARAPGAACPGSPAHLACAAEGYAAARAMRDAPALAAGEAQARLCLAELSAPAAGAAIAAQALAASRAAPPDRAPALAARAALILARPGAAPDAARCAAAREGLRHATPRDAADLRARIATIPGCPGDAP